jgi:hypothetical protein
MDSDSREGAKPLSEPFSMEQQPRIEQENAHAGIFVVSRIRKVS